MDNTVTDIDTAALFGRKQIQTFTHRSWPVIRKWIAEENFPARKIDGVWESDKGLIRAWKLSKINCQ